MIATTPVQDKVYTVHMERLRWAICCRQFSAAMGAARGVSGVSTDTA